MLIFLLSFLDKWAVYSSWLFIPILAKEMGANLFQVGLVSFFFGLGGCISYYLFGRLSDVLGRRKEFISAGFFLSSLIILLHLNIPSLNYLIFLRFLAGFMMGIYSFPLIVLASLSGRRERRVSLVNAFASLGTFLGWLWAGICRRYSLIFISSAILFFLNSLFSLSLKEKKGKRIHIPLLPKELIRKNRWIYLPFLLRHTGASAIWAILPVFLVSLGGSKIHVSTIYALNPLVQFSMILLLLPWIERISSLKIFTTGLFLSSLSFILYSSIPDYRWAYLVSVIVGVSWATLYTGALLYLVSKNVERGTATGLLGSAFSVAMMVGPFIGGTLSHLFSMRISILFSGILSLTSWGTFLIFGRKFKV
ncbi:MAG TPA: MFS transporter [bacterium]|nr:MFS transporter [bacterium]HEX67752.1 MFS transporter [bacterium]